MSRFLRFLGSLSLSLGFVLSLAATSEAVAQPTRAAIPEQVSKIDSYPFPKQIGDLTRGLKTDYNSPGLGFSVSYRNPGGTWVDIYVYDLGTKVSSNEAAEQLEQALGDIATATSAGAYEEAKLIRKFNTGIYHSAHMKITQKQKTRDSYIFITVYNNSFVKIRLTTSSTDSNRLAQTFAGEYAALLKR